MIQLFTLNGFYNINAEDIMWTFSPTVWTRLGDTERCAADCTIKFYNEHTLTVRVTSHEWDAFLDKLRSLLHKEPKA